MDHLLAETGFNPPKQVLISVNKPGVVRGMHYQWPHPMGKLVVCVEGTILDIVVDVRRGSPKFGTAHMFLLNPECGGGLWVPRGFAHGFQVKLDQPAVVVYACDALYNPECDRTIHPEPYFWLLRTRSCESLVSEKDRKAPTLDEVFNNNPEYLPCMDLMS